MTIRYAYTDYPLTGFGDVPGKPAPVRRVKVLAYDKNKYCLVELCSRPWLFAEIKSDYLYATPSRIEASRPFPRRWLRWLPTYDLMDEWFEARERVRQMYKSALR